MKRTWKRIIAGMFALLLCFSMNMTEALACGSHYKPCCSTKTGTVNVKVTKEWCNDTEEVRPESCTMILYANGRETSRVQLTAGNGWSYVWNKLSKYNYSGKEITYTIKEVPVEGYTTTYSEMVKVSGSGCCHVCKGRHSSGCHSKKNTTTCYSVTVTNTREEVAVMEASYTVHYVDTEGNPLAEDKVVTGQEAGMVITETAVAIEGYTPLAPTEQTVELQEGYNELTFVYEKESKEASYTVHYVDTEGNPLAEDKVVTGQEVGMVITETAITIEGYTPLTPTEQTMELQEGSNELTFIYEKEATYRVTYDLNGGYGNLPVDETEYRAGDMVTISEEYNIEIEKGLFTGYWSKKPLPLQDPDSFIGEGCYELGTTFEMGDEDVTLYAVYTARMD